MKNEFINGYITNVRCGGEGPILLTTKEFIDGAQRRVMMQDDGTYKCKFNETIFTMIYCK